METFILNLLMILITVSVEQIVIYTVKLLFLTVPVCRILLLVPPINQKIYWNEMTATSAS